MTAQFSIAVSIGLAATFEDIARRRISNWICLTGLLAGLACNSFQGGWRGALSGLGGAIGGFLIFLIFYWMGAMGGGDVKLMAGLGSVAGVERLPAAALGTAACGGVIAILYLAVMAARKLWLKEMLPTVRHIPYAPAIAAGYWMALAAKP